MENSKQQCTNCKCYRETNLFIGAKGLQVKRCQKCREKDARQKKKLDVIEKRNALNREKKYYETYRQKKRNENEAGFLQHNAEIMKHWRENNQTHLREWRMQNVSSRLNGLKQQGLKKGYTWEIDDEYAKTLMSSRCFYCDYYDPKCVNGIDRMDNKLGYKNDNVVSCCKFCNFIKKGLDSHTFVERCKHISCTHSYPSAWPDCKRSSYKMYENRAKKKNLQFELTKEQFENICAHPCTYCRRPSDVLNQNGIDRKNNTIGYDKDNCLSCCRECNQMKCILSFEMFMETCARVAKHSSQYNIPDMPRCLHVIS